MWCKAAGLLAQYGIESQNISEKCIPETIVATISQSNQAK